MRKRLLSGLLVMCQVFLMLPCQAEAVSGAGHEKLSYVEIISPQYEDVEEFSEGLAAVKKNGKWGYIDTEGTVVIPFQYDDAGSFSEGYAIVCTLAEGESYQDQFSEEETWYDCYQYGLIDKNGNLTYFERAHSPGDTEYFVQRRVQRGADFPRISRFSGGIANLSWAWQGDWGAALFGLDGKELILEGDLSGDPGDPDPGYWNYYAGEWPVTDETTILVYSAPTDVVPQKYYDFTTNQTFAPTYDISEGAYPELRLRPFNQGLAPVGVPQVNGSTLWGFVDKTGAWVIAPVYRDYMVYRPKESAQVFFEAGEKELAVVADQQGLWGAIDKSGNKVIDFKYADLSPFHCGLAAAIEADSGEQKAGYIGPDGNYVIPPQYQYAGSFGDVGVAIVSKDGTSFCLIDKTGNPLNGSEGLDLGAYWTNQDGMKPLFIPSNEYVVIRKQATGEFDKVESSAFLYGFGKVVNGTPLLKSMFTVDTTVSLYTGNPITKAIFGQCGDQTLVLDTDYTVSYANNINAGTATITITGIGDYSGILTYTFSILAAPVGITVAEVLAPKYDRIDNFFDGLALVTLDRKYGFVNAAGQEVIPCIYDFADSFDHGLAKVSFTGGCRYGFINTAGQEIVPSNYYGHDYNGVNGGAGGGEKRDGFSEGLMRVDKDYKDGFINDSGQEVIPCIYDRAYAFSEGRAMVATYDGEDERGVPIYKYGFIDTQGNLVVPCKYDDARSFSEGLALVCSNGKYGYIDATGREVIPCKYDKAEKFSSGLAEVGMGNPGSRKYGFINSAGQEVAPLQYEDSYNAAEGEPWSFCEGLRIVRRDGRYGFINTSGQETIPCKYDSVGNFSFGLAPVCIDDISGTSKWGFIDSTGQEVIPCQYELSEEGHWKGFTEGLIAVGQDDKWGLIDSSGKQIVSYKYDYVGVFSEGLAPVRLHDKYGFIDTAGQEIIPCKYGYVGEFENGFALVRAGDYRTETFGLIDLSGQEVVPCKYRSIHFVSDNLMAVSVDNGQTNGGGKYGLLSIQASPIRVPLTTQMFTVDTASVFYTGNPITKSISGQNGETPLIPDVDYTVSYADNINVGTATITITGIGSYAGSLTYSFSIQAAPSGGGSSGGSSSGGGSSTSSYTVSAPSNIKNGSVQFSGKNAKKGDVVTITVSPDKGYQFSKLTVTDKNGKALKLTDLGNGKFSFIMPGSKVTVDALFEEAPPIPTPSPSPAEPTQSPVGSAPVSDRFTDINSSDWFTSAVQYVCDKGMMNGMGTDTFTPQAPASRAMLVTILHRLEGEPAADSAAFSDVPSSGYYAGAVAWASANHIVNGFEDNSFRPDNSITREQLAVILYRYAAQKGLDTTASADLSGFVDLDLVSGYALPALRWANATGLITGTDWGGLYPGGTATRAETAAILMRFCENILSNEKEVLP